VRRTVIRRAAVPVALAASLSLAACSSSSGGSSASPSSSAAGVSSSAAAGGASASPAGGTSSSAPASTAKLSGTLAGAGSSAQTAAMAAWVAGFQSANSGVTVNYNPIGSGGGVTAFLAGSAAYAGSDAYLTTAQLTSSQKVCGSGGAIDLPVYISPIAVIYNLPSVKSLKLDSATIAKIFLGSIKTWDDPAIKALNPGTTLPSTAITPVHRSDKSGTTNNFTDYLSKTAPSAWTAAPDEVWPASGGESGNGTSGLVAAVKGGTGTIGYADNSQAAGLGVVSIKVGSAYNAPSAAGAATAVSASTPTAGRPAGDLAIDVNRTTTAAGAYPLVLLSYDVACTTYSNAQTGALVKGLMTYITSSAGQESAAKTAGSAPISSSLATKDAASVAMIKVG
jgi:phosphate transport system substrate-binding protein